MRKSNRERLRDAQTETYQPLQTNLRGLFRLMLGDEPNPTQWDFICSDEQNKAYKGPAGCAKTSTLMASGLARALLQPGSKGFVGRYDYNKLLGTTVDTAEKMLDNLPKGVLLDRDKTPPMKWWIRPVVEGPVSKITFAGLKDKLGSYEFDWACVDEADEVEEHRVQELSSRLRNPGFDGKYSLSLAFNPPDKTHWIYTACTGLDHQGRTVKEPWLKLWSPQPRENVAHLPRNYYENMAAHMPEDMRQRLVFGEWGSTFPGAPVYRQFKEHLHCKYGLQFSPHEPLFRFWDFGYQHPACIWAQLTWEGRLLILRECLGTNEEATAFARRCKAITTSKYPSAKEVIDFGDPAVRQRKDVGQTLAVFAREGIHIRYMLLKVEPGLREVRSLLERLIEGEPAIVFDKDNCPILTQALKGGYHLDDKGVEPIKDGYYDHLADALRYGVTNIFKGAGGRPVSIGDIPDSVEFNLIHDQVNVEFVGE